MFMVSLICEVDTYKRSGNYGALPPLPWCPGSDGAGVVEEVGEDVDLKV
jgi:NADPH2:quinone reductase